MQARNEFGSLFSAPEPAHGPTQAVLDQLQSVRDQMQSLSKQVDRLGDQRSHVLFFGGAHAVESEVRECAEQTISSRRVEPVGPDSKLCE